MQGIEKRGPSSYRLTVSCGYDSNGKKIVRRKTTNLSNLTPAKQTKEAQRQLIIFQDEVEHGLHINTGKLTLKGFSETWIKEYAEANLAPKTLHDYKRMLSLRILPALGHIKIANLNPGHLTSFYSNLREDGMRLDQQYRARLDFFDTLAGHTLTPEQLATNTKISKRTIAQLKKSANISYGLVKIICEAVQLSPDALFDLVGHDKGLSDRTVRYHHAVISSILTSAMQWGYISSNPASRIKPPKVAKKEATHFELDQIKYMLSLIDQQPIKYKTMVYLSIFGGMRTGELNALQWSDISWEDSSIRISKALQYLPGKGTFSKSPKNESSERVISLPPSMMQTLREHKLWQNGEKTIMGDLWIDTNYLFTQENGKAIFPQTIGKWFSTFLRTHNEEVMKNASIASVEKEKYLLDKVTYHGLRHSSATLLISQNIDILTVSRRMGHSSISTTLNTYAHASKKLDRSASDSLGELLSDKTDTVKRQNK